MTLLWRTTLSLFWLVGSTLALGAAPYFPAADSTWETTTPTAAGASAALLNEAVAYAGSARSEALVVLHQGRILVEQYWNGHNRQSLFSLYSASKVLTGAVVGQLVAEGRLTSLEQKTADWLPEWRGVAGKQDITLWQHLAMCTGIEGGETNLFLQGLARSERFFALNLPLQYAPGTFWTYNNPPYRLLFYVIEAAQPVELSTTFLQRLAQPLGMSALELVIRTETFGQQTIRNYQNFRANALSAARFGWLYAQRGKWGEQQVVPADFVDQSLRPSQPMNPSYGLLWWLNGGATAGGNQQLFDGVWRAGPYYPDAPPDTVAALGLNDQIIAVIPSLGLVVVRLGQQPLGGGSEAVSIEQNLLLGKLARAFGYGGQAQTAPPRVSPSGTELTFTWPSWYGRRYAVEQSASPTLATGWTGAVELPGEGDGLPRQHTVTAPPGAPSQYWRVRSSP